VVVVRSFGFLGVFQSVGYIRTHCKLVEEKKNHGKQGQIIVDDIDVVHYLSSPHMKVGMTHNVHHVVFYDCQQHEMNKISGKIHPTQPPKPLLYPLPLLLL
jgi:hypothetical protein